MIFFMTECFTFVGHFLYLNLIVQFLLIKLLANLQTTSSSKINSVVFFIERNSTLLLLFLTFNKILISNL